MKATVVHRANLEDATAILQLQREAYQSEALLYNDWSIPPLTQTLEQLHEEFLSGSVFKAMQGAALVGSVRARVVDGAVHIGRLIVAPAAQRQGIGSALLRHVEAAFPKAERFELFTGSLSEANIRLYGKHGYAVTQEKVLSSSVTLVFMSKQSEAAV
jgi:ribosomal protein S18 acetylase RimI-like enzyme